MIFHRCLLFVFALLLVERVSFAQFGSLANRVPSDANSLVLMDIDKIMDSPAAAAGNWKKKVDGAFASGITLVPPATQQAIFASHIDLEFMSPIWQSVMVRMDSAPNTGEIAKRTGGSPDQIGRFPAVRLPQDAYVIHFQEGVYGIMTPANRQAVGKWVMQVGKRTDPELSPYLMEAYGYASKLGTPIIMALDLENALSEEEIKSRLKDRWEEAGLTGKADPLAVSHVLAGIRGITLGITLREKPFGKIKIDFTDDAAPLAAIAKPLFLHVLDHRGVTIDEFADWKYETSGKQITLEGNFTSSGLRRIFSVFDRPPSLAGAQVDSSQDTTNTSKPQTQEQKAAQATLAYYQNVQHLLKDLKAEKSNSGTYSTGSIAQWCDNYARKIGCLPKLNVDPDMLAYGNGVASTLTNVSLTLKGGGVKGGIDAKNVPTQYNTYTQNTVYGYTSRWDLYGGGGAAMPVGYSNTYSVVNDSATAAERSKARAKARAESSQQARQIFATIPPATTEISTKMTQKYQIEFK